MRSSARIATLTLCSALAVQVAALRRADAIEAHLLVYNADSNASLVQLLDDATGFTVSLEERFPSDRSLAYKVVSYVRDRCSEGGTAAYFAMDALRPTRFVGPVRCSGIEDRQAAVDAAKRTEDDWYETIRNWPNEVQGSMHVRLGAILGRAYSKISHSCAMDMRLRGFLPKPLQETTGPLGAFGFTYCRTPANEPVAPFADLAIVSSGIDAGFASAATALSLRQPAVARRAARAAVTHLLGVASLAADGSAFSHTRYSGTWSTTCRFSPVIGRGVLGEVKVSCTSQGSDATVSHEMAVGAKRSSLSVVRVRAAVPLGVEDGLLVAGYSVLTAKLDLAVTTTRTRVSISRVRHMARGDASDVRSAPIYLRGGSELSPHSMHYAVRTGRGCYFWFESPNGAAQLGGTGSCSYGQVSSVGATVFYSTCACQEILEAFASGAWTID